MSIVRLESQLRDLVLASGTVERNTSTKMMIPGTLILIELCFGVLWRLLWLSVRLWKNVEHTAPMTRRTRKKSALCLLGQLALSSEMTLKSRKPRMVAS